MYTFDEIATPGCCPNADEVESDLCDHDLKSIPDGIDGGCPLMLDPTAETGAPGDTFRMHPDRRRSKV